MSLTTFLLGLSLGQLLVVPLSDAFGRRVPLWTGLAVYAVSSLLCALIPSIWALIALRFIQGLAGAAGMVVARAVVRDLYSGTEMNRFFSHLMLVNGVAAISAPVIGAQLMRFLPWQEIFVTLALFGGALSLAVFLGLPETLPAAVAGLWLAASFTGSLVSRFNLISGSGIPQVKGLILGYLQQNWLATLLAKFLGGAAVILSGLALDREEPSFNWEPVWGKGLAASWPAPLRRKRS